MTAENIRETVARCISEGREAEQQITEAAAGVPDALLASFRKAHHTLKGSIALLQKHQRTPVHHEIGGMLSNMLKHMYEAERIASEISRAVK